MSGRMGVRVEEGRILVDEDGWAALIDTAAEPDAESFAAVLGVDSSSPLTSEVHWSVRAHIGATLGIDVVGRSCDGVAVGASASSDGSRGLLLLDTAVGRWDGGADPVTVPDQERQVLPVLASLLPISLLEIMQVGPRPGLGIDDAVSLPAADLTALLWRETGVAVPSQGVAGQVATVLAREPWRHWRVRVTGQQPGGQLVEDGLDVVVLRDGMLGIEAVTPDELEVREVSPVSVLVRLVEAMRPGLALPS
ncbi:MAG: hypothetical protein ACTMHL_06680 [Janibacter sp.]